MGRLVIGAEDKILALCPRLQLPAFASSGDHHFAMVMTWFESGLVFFHHSSTPILQFIPAQLE